MSPKSTTINDDHIKGIRSKEDNNNNNNNNNTYLSKNHRQRRKGPGFLLACCKPVVMDGVIEPIATGGARREKGSGLKGEQPAVFRYINVEERKDGIAFPGLQSSSTSTSSSSSSSSSLDVEGVISNKKNKKCRKKFSRIVKAVLFETSLAKRVKCRNDGKKSSRSNWKHSGDEVEKDSNTIKENSKKPVHQEPAKKDGATPLYPSSLLSNSRSSSGRNLPSLNSAKTKQKQRNKLQEEGKGCCSCDTGLCLLLVSLLFFLFWGKVCAILCTATWMFFLPCFNNGKKSLQNGVDLHRVIDPDEYKKRIVMEGLLDRNRSRGV